MMTDNIIWLDFNDAPEQHAVMFDDIDALRQGLLDRLAENFKLVVASI